MSSLPLSVFVLPWQSKIGLPCPAAVAWPQYFEVNGQSKQAQIEWHVFASEELFLAWFAGQAVGGVPVEEVEVVPYALTGAEFLAAYSGILTGAVSLVDVIFGKALGTLDTDSGQTDAGGKPVMVSRFASAQRVTLNVPVGA